VIDSNDGRCCSAYILGLLVWLSSRVAWVPASLRTGVTRVTQCLRRKRSCACASTSTDQSRLTSSSEGTCCLISRLRVPASQTAGDCSVCALQVTYCTLHPSLVRRMARISAQPPWRRSVTRLTSEDIKRQAFFVLYCCLSGPICGRQVDTMGMTWSTSRAMRAAGLCEDSEPEQVEIKLHRVAWEMS